MATLLTAKVLKETRNSSQDKDTYVLGMAMLYKNKQTIMFKVVGAVIYSLYTNYICNDCLCLHQEKLYNKYSSLILTTFDYLYGSGIPDVLMNSMYCHGF